MPCYASTSNPPPSEPPPQPQPPKAPTSRSKVNHLAGHLPPGQIMEISSGSK